MTEITEPNDEQKKIIDNIKRVLGRTPNKSINKTTLLKSLQEFLSITNREASAQVKSVEEFLKRDGTLTQGARRSLLFGLVAQTPAAAPTLVPNPSGAAQIVPATSIAQFSTVNLSDASMQAVSQRVNAIVHQQLANIITGQEFARFLRQQVATAVHQPQLGAAALPAQLPAAQTLTTSIAPSPASVELTGGTPSTVAPTPSSAATPSASGRTTSAPTPSSAATPSASGRTPEGIEGIPADPNPYTPLSKKQ